MPTMKLSARSDVSVVLKEADWKYVIAKLRKAIEPGCYEKSYCQLLDVIPKIEKQVKEASHPAGRP
jgi:hypothetical protein